MMDQLRTEEGRLSDKTSSAIQTANVKFANIVTYLHENEDVKREWTPEMKTHLNHLVRLWNNNADSSADYYFKMKEHHHHINGRIVNETLKTMWNDYLAEGLRFRVDLLKLDDLRQKKDNL